MKTCGKCGRSYDTRECMYCWGFETGMKINQANYEAEYGTTRKGGGRSGGGGCALVVLAAAALPVPLAAAWTLAAIQSG